MDEEKYERYIPVEQSIIESLLEVREMRAGRKPKTTWDEFLPELRATVAMVEEEERANKNGLKDHRINRSL